MANGVLTYGRVDLNPMLNQGVPIRHYRLACEHGDTELHLANRSSQGDTQVLGQLIKDHRNAIAKLEKQECVCQPKGYVSDGLTWTELPDPEDNDFRG